jgi:hypothetical protein
LLLRCEEIPKSALPCVALRCLALSCVILRYLISRYKKKRRRHEDEKETRMESNHDPWITSRIFNLIKELEKTLAIYIDSYVCEYMLFYPILFCPALS